MLGSLAKWMRILGFDTAYNNRINDQELVERCLNEDRIALTRDRRLVRRRALRYRHLLIEGDDLGGQIGQVLRKFPEPPREDLFSRCLRCNVLLVPLERERARDQVPLYVFRTQESFKRCPQCGRILWKGTHRNQILEQLRKMGHPRQKRSPEDG